MSRTRGVIGLAAAIVFVAACSSGTTSSSTSPSTAAAGSSLHFYFVTHGDNGTFWSVVQKGEKQAATDLGVSVNYQGSNNDDNQECQFISAAVTAKPDGLVVSPHSQTVLDCAKQAASSGIPLILMNNCGTTSSGQSYVAYSGAQTCVEQPESAAGTQAVQCSDCAGTGQVRRNVQSIFGQMVNVSACPRCRGEGRIVEHPCPTCRGQGRVDERQRLDITIPPGVDDDVTLRYAGQGEAGPRGGGRGAAEPQGDEPGTRDARRR